MGQSISFALVMVVILTAAAIGSRRQRLGEPFHRRPAAIVLLVCVLIIVGLCAWLATRHGP